MITIQVKDPYTSVYRSGLRITYGQAQEVNPEDPRVMFWLDSGKVEKVEPDHSKKAIKEKEL